MKDESAEKVKIAVVGAGRLGGFHADKIAASTKSELVGVCDPLEENRRRVAERYGVPGFADPAEILGLADAVVVAAPSTDHYRLGLFFLQNGKHLLMEKPLAVTGGEAKELAAEAARRRLVLQTGHVERCNPAWTAAVPLLREMKESGPLLIDAVRTSPYSFRCVDVGAALDIMIHDLELVLTLINSPVRRVEADGFVQFGGHEDLCSARVEFDGGHVASFLASRIEPASRRVMNVRHREKRITIDFAARRVEIVTPDRAILTGDFAPDRVRYAEILPSIPTFMADHYRTKTLEMSPVDALALEEDRFAEAILGSDGDSAGDRGAEAVELAEAILDRMKESRGR